jgi:DNA-binding winged helix-turn-helix (wHTH) protein/Tfp pilus assembly protein PilF
MKRIAPAGRFVRFGSFEADLQEGTLTKMGRRIRLQEQPFRILALLLERSGQLVTREEIRQKLWSHDTFVGFDDALNTAVRKLRDALNDSADNPRFLETVPRKGYRFVAPVDWPPEPQAVAPIKSRVRRHPYLWLAAALIVAGTAVEGYWHLRRPGSQIAPEDTIVLADFANSTGEAIFDDTLKTALSVSLRQSPFLNVLSDGEVAKTLHQMKRPEGTKLTAEVARELCQRAGSKAYVAGAIGSLGSEYVLELKAVNCQSGDTLAQEQVTAASKERVLDALGEAASKVRGKLGESLAMVRKFDVPLEQATTSSLEALKTFSLGCKILREKDATAALPFSRHAIELDPNFAMGYLEVGIEYNNLGEAGRASEYFSKAFQLREHATEPEELIIAAGYYQGVTRELDKAAQTYQEQIEIYPREARAYGNLGIVFSHQGQYDRAMQIMRQALRLAPDRLGNYENLANYALALQRLDETRQIIHEAQARKTDDFVLHNTLYALAFLGADSAAMEEQQQWYAGKPEENSGLSLASDTEAYGGHLGKARERPSGLWPPQFE